MSLARLSGLQCVNMDHNGHGINLYGVVMILMGILHAGGQSNLGHLSLLHRSTMDQCSLSINYNTYCEIFTSCLSKYYLW